MSCDSELSICNKFPHSGTPRLFLVKSGIESNEFYYNTYSLNEFISFIEKRITEMTISKISDHMQFKEIIKSDENSSLFFLQDINSDLNEQIFENILKKYKNAPTKFYKLEYKEFDNETKPIVIYLSPITNVTDTLYLEANSDKLIEDFVELHSFPPIYKATTFFFKEHLNKSTPFMLYYENGIFFTKDLIEMAKTFPKYLKTGVINCSEVPRMCHTFGVRFNEGNQLTIVYPTKSVYYHYEGEYNSNDIMLWIDNVMNNKEIPLGPGA